MTLCITVFKRLKKPLSKFKHIPYTQRTEENSVEWVSMETRYVWPGATGHYYRLDRQDISREAQRRLAWFDWYWAHGRNARLTCRHFGISPDTFYRWKQRYDRKRLSSLESSSRRPHRFRQRAWRREWIDAVRRWREKYPRWGKEKIWTLMGGPKAPVSASTVGRMLEHLKRKGLIREPVKLAMARRKRRPARPWARRKPAAYEVREPGDLVQVDTLDQEILPGLRRKQFTARDMVSKYDALQAYSTASSRCAKLFLDYLSSALPFAIKALQIDGGSEFKGEFEQECAARKLPLFVLPPRSPKLNGCVERANRTHTEEFYEVHEIPADLEHHNRKLKNWENTYNFIRPHQALGYRTPAQFVQRFYEFKT